MVCKSARRYVAGTKYGHLTGPLWACIKMTVDKLLESEPILGSKSQKIGMVCAKVPVDTLLAQPKLRLKLRLNEF